MLTEISNSRNKKTLQIEYMLGNLCNYKCSYCFYGSNEGDCPWPDVDVASKNLIHLMDKYKEAGKENFEFYLLGGEATLWNNLPQLIQNLKERHNVKIHMSTNASRGTEWWEKNGKYFDQVSVSVHHEFSKIQHLMDVCDILYKNLIDVSANVLMDQKAFERCIDIVEEMKNSKYPFPIIARIVHYNGSTSYTEEQERYFDKRVKRYPELEWIQQLPKHESVKVYATIDNEQRMVSENYFMLHDLNHFKGWSCNLGVDHIEISRHGRISGNCGEFIYNMDDYFNINDSDFPERFHPEIKPVTCSKSICVCEAEITIYKKLPV